MSNKMNIILLIIVIICVIVAIVIFMNRNNTTENLQQTNEYNNALKVERDNQNINTNEFKNMVENNMQKYKNNI